MYHVIHTVVDMLGLFWDILGYIKLPGIFEPKNLTKLSYPESSASQQKFDSPIPNDCLGSV